MRFELHGKLFDGFGLRPLGTVNTRHLLALAVKNICWRGVERTSCSAESLQTMRSQVLDCGGRCHDMQRVGVREQGDTELCLP